MNPHRTFGVEIECISKIPREDLASMINESEYFRNSEYQAVSSIWCRQTNPRNTKTWIVKYDASIITNKDYPYQVEVVSPVLSGNEGLVVIGKVLEVLDKYCIVNKTCGLHVHHGLIDDDNLINILRAWLRVEDTIYSCLPQSRSEGRYAQKLTSKVNKNPRSIHNLRQWWGSKVRERYYGINFESVWIRNTVEVRAAAGTLSFEKVKNWVILTQKLVDLGSKNPLLFQEGIENLINVLTGDGRRKARREGTIAAFLDNLLMEGSYMPDMVVALRDFRRAHGFPEVSERKLKETIYDYIWQLRRDGITVIREGKYYQFEEQPTVDQDIAEATSWLRQRYIKFQRVPAATVEPGISL